MNVFLVLIMLNTTPTKIPCLLIKPFVATYGQEAVVGWARAHGYNDVQISEVTKRCIVKSKR